MSPSRAVAVIGGCGGAGGSLTALGLAFAFERAGHPAVLVDLDGERGDLAGGLGSLAARTVLDLVGVAHELTADHVRAASVLHPSGVALIPGAPVPDPERLRELVGPLLELVDGPNLVIDAGSGVTPVARALAGRCPLLLVAPCDAAGCRVARRTAGLLGTGGMALVVNRGGRPAELSPRAVARAIGLPAQAMLPPAPAEAVAVGAGMPWSGRRARLARACDELAAHLIAQRAA